MYVVRIAVLFALVAAGFAQQLPLFNAASTSKANAEIELQKKEQSQRMFGLVPMFDVTSRTDAPPLTSRQKFKLFVKGAVDPFDLFVTGIGTGIAHANNEPVEYGQGAAGYGKRYGASLANGVSSGFFGGFVYPTMLKQDPRYFRRGEGPVFSRIGYALAQAFVCRSDTGKHTANYSKILGIMTASGISNFYYPPRERGLEDTMSRSGVALVNASLGGLIDEFWPDIYHKFLHKKD